MTITTVNENLPINRPAAGDIDIVANAMNGIGWATGGVVAAQASPNMTVTLTAGTIAIPPAPDTVAFSGNSALAIASLADATRYRVDIISVSQSGTVVVTQGTENTGFEPPDIPGVGGATPNVALYFVLLPPGTTAITNALLMDKRCALGVQRGVLFTSTGGVTFFPFYTATTKVGTSQLLQTATDICTDARGFRVNTSAGVGGTFMVNAAGQIFFYSNSSPSDGQLLIGNTANSRFDKATLTAGAGISVTNAAGAITIAATGSGTGDVVGPAASVDSEVALFSGTTGKLLKRASGTGITRVASGVQSAAELSGDVTTSGSNVVTIANDAVTYAKQQNVSAASRLLGRGSASGSGDCEEITLGAGLTMTGTALSASGGSSADTLGVLASDATSTNSTLANLTGVSVAIAGNGTEVWQVDLQLILVNGSGGTTADWKFGWAVPAGMTGFWGSHSNVLAQDEWGTVATSSTPTALLTESQTKVFGGANTGVQGLHIWGTFYSGGTAGTLQLQFAQNTTNAAAQTVKRGSGGIFRKMLT